MADGDAVNPNPSGTPTPTPEESTAAVQPNPPQPTAPPKESIKQGFVRGMRGEQYAVDAQGNLVNMRTTEVSPRGTFGSILAGAVVGALAGARSARPGGIPSHELRGGPGAGAAAANESVQGRDVRAREQAGVAFGRKTEAQKAQDEHLQYQADIHMKGLQELNLAHTLDVAEREDPLHYEQLKNATELGQVQLESEVKNLGLINERTYAHYADVPKGDIDKFGRNQVKIMTMPDGSVKVWDRTFDPRATPNSADFEIKDLAALDPKTGKAEWRTVGTVKAGQGTAAQLEAEIDKERTQLMSFAKQNSDTAKNESEAKKNEAEAEKFRKEAEALGGENMESQARMLVDGDLDPSQMSKRTNVYNAQLAAADKYSMEHYGKHWDPAQANIDFKFSQQPATQNTLKYLNSLVGADNKSGNLGILVGQSNKINRTQFPAINDAKAWAKIQTGSKDMAVFRTTVLEVSDQIAKILQGGGSGSATSDSKLKQAQDILNTGFTKEQIQGIADDLRGLLSNRKNELIGNNRYLLKQFAPETATPKARTIPPAVTAALANVGPGRHTLSDKSVWIKAADGTITAATSQGQ